MHANRLYGNMVKLSPFARLLYIGMWNFTLCDHGHVADDAMKLKLQILPMDNVDIDALLAEIMALGRVDSSHLFAGSDHAR